MILIMLLTLLSGCGAPSSQAKPIRIAVLGILDALPLFAAESQGYFKNNGVNVELITVGSAPERDQLFQAGQVEGMLNELVASMVLNQDQQRAVVVRFLRVASSQYPLFRILAAKDSGIKTPADLKGVAIGVSEGTVIEYVTDRVLVKAGLSQSEIKKIGVPKIPDRLALLESGQLKVAVLPDPTASVAIAAGAVVVIDDTTYPEVSHSVLTFSAETVKNNPQSVRAVLKAVEQAVLDINANKSRYKQVMIDKKFAPPDLIEKYNIPDFPKASVPSEAQFNDSLTWAKASGIIKGNVTYSSTVVSSYLP
jgi:NitT/TauT family transport system substrate-binding protein